MPWASKFSALMETHFIQMCDPENLSHIIYEMGHQGRPHMRVQELRDPGTGAVSGYLKHAPVPL